jgi:hypothetical protein
VVEEMVGQLILVHLLLQEVKEEMHQILMIKHLEAVEVELHPLILILHLQTNKAVVVEL